MNAKKSSGVSIDQPVLKGHLDSFEMGVHAHVYTCDRAVDYCTVLQLNCHCLVRQFHQEPGRTGIRYYNQSKYKGLYDDRSIRKIMWCHHDNEFISTLSESSLHAQHTLRTRESGRVLLQLPQNKSFEYKSRKSKWLINTPPNTHLTSFMVKKSQCKNRHQKNI